MRYVEPSKSKTRFIGDVHGKITKYQEKLAECSQSIQVGDMGIGFVDFPEISINHRFIRGNHDNPRLARAKPNFIQDGTFFEEASIFLIGGARSIDQEYRIEDHSWWRDEEVNYAEAQSIVEKYETITLNSPINVIVSHDLPQFMAEKMFQIKNNERSITRDLLDRIYEIHAPKIWIFGHWHERRTEMFENTRFECLGELDTLDLDLANI